jgi:hypothetical protein
MTEMKLLYERWHFYLAEQGEGADAGLTWQELALAIEGARLARAGELDKDREKQLAKTLGKSALGLLSLLTGGVAGVAMGATSTVVDVAGGLFKTYIQQDDSKTPDNPFLKAFNLSDGFQALIDDELEDAFISDMIPRVERMVVEQPAEKVPNMDKMIQDWLAQKNIGGTKGNSVTKSLQLKSKE